MGFRKSQTIIRTAPGAYVRGEWVDGAPAPLTIQASVQPVTGQELLVLPEGRRSSDVVKIYTSSELLASAEGQQPDVLAWRGHSYEISMKADYQSDVINHFKYYATKVPNDAA